MYERCKELGGDPDQHDQGHYSGLPPGPDHPRDGVEDVMLHVAADRYETFRRRYHGASGRGLVHEQARRGHEQQQQREQGEESAVRERGGALGAVYLVELLRRQPGRGPAAAENFFNWLI